MARQLRLEYAGAIYHVSGRMVGDHPSALASTNWPPEKRLFRDDADHWRFIDRLAERVEQHHIRLYLFVLMTNHFHLVFETPEANCSTFMQSLLTAYTVYYNLRHHRHGHLLDGRYKAKLVDSDAYLLALSRYVHMNPINVEAWKHKPIEERIRYLRYYPWSSYPSYIGRRKALEFVEYEPMRAEVGGAKGQEKSTYRKFVESGMAEDDEDFRTVMRASPRSIGAEAFRAWVDERYEELLIHHNTPEDVSFRHTATPLPADLILRTAAEQLGVDVDDFLKRGRNSPLRAVAATMLIRFGGYTQRQAAEALRIGTGGAVSVQVRRLPDLLSKDRTLRRRMKRIETELAAVRHSDSST
ncbi:MAG: transposase [Lentisphaerae bacterium]|nr:transposase [Lentisphaerota bacterium]